jgi:hypothetical protein
MNLSINIDTWNKTRELNYCPKHFVAATTSLTEESKLWVLERLHGRYYISLQHMRRSIFDNTVTIYFEDPQEAVLYELTWS